MELKGLRTLQTDIQEYTKKGVSSFDLAAEEARRGGLKFSGEEKRPSPKKLVIILIITFFIIGAGIGSFWFLNKKTEKQEPISLLPKPIILGDEQVEININPNNPSESLKNIQEAIQKTIRPNHLLYISLPKITGREFLRIIGTNPPLELLDSLTNEFMLAKFYLTKDWPILIFKIRFYESAFWGMIKWEETISNDLSSIFSPSKPGFDFQDKEIQNHDTRVLNNENGNSVLIYSFINQKYLIISQDIEPIKEIFRRFSSPQYLF